MRTFTIIIFLSLILGIGFSSMAFAAPDNSPSQICKENDDFDLSHDTCTVCVAQRNLDVINFDELTPTCACKILQDSGLLAPGVSLGDCISVFPLL
jgi:hypothetical protein